MEVLCGLVAGFTHFAFLSVFCWMLGQGIYILLQLGYQMLSKVRMKKRHYALFGWGLPAVIVGLTAAIKSGFCWLSTEEGGVWAFIGPVIAILVVSMSAFFWAMRSFLSVKAFKNKSEMDKLWSSLRAVTILAPTLGLTWLFGIFVNLHVSFQYIFAILNSLQGFLLLVFQVAANDEVS
ncbi:adhesion G-protein coupled receptor D1-like [Strongylocentrotus purpuratus]|uniref:G-protein coupled receptors family 2 profile 2 domain-containing protein n=1 Tax=Strongylocentrotus purpuratus TaxID=7668 RepID=A0A7M7NVK0_STRPU|nr:adhesion G-protein coupled receptor D1-like [Strongylocentrotus purpuratus]